MLSEGKTFLQKKHFSETLSNIRTGLKPVLLNCCGDVNSSHWYLIIPQLILIRYIFKPLSTRLYEMLEVTIKVFWNPLGT